MRDRDTTCPICGHRFESEPDLDAHVPCSEPGDERRAPWSVLSRGRTYHALSPADARYVRDTVGGVIVRCDL